MGNKNGLFLIVLAALAGGYLNGYRDGQRKSTPMLRKDVIAIVKDGSCVWHVMSSGAETTAWPENPVCRSGDQQPNFPKSGERMEGK